MTYETTVKRNLRGELKAETLFDLPGVTAKGADGRQGETKLSITTYKAVSKRGFLNSHASVNFYGDTMICHVYGGKGGDFGGFINEAPGRCTEKTLRALHAEALKRVPEIIELAKAFYAAQTKPEALAA